MPKMSLFARLFGRSQKIPASAALARLMSRAMLISLSGFEALVSAAQAAKTEAYRDDEEWTPHGSRPEHLVTIDGTVGILSIHGPLFQRWDMWAWFFGGSGYDVIGAAFDMLLANDAVKTIVLDVDSPGGECAGCPDLADHIRAARGVKPMHAVINDSGYSAAYWLASAADQVTVTRTAGCGNVGVISTHVDVSKMDEKWGVAFEYVYAGDKKADYHARGPLPESVRGELQAEVDRLYEMFATGVAENRGLTVDAVKATQAGCYYGPGAVQVGFADSVGTLGSVVVSLAPEEDEEPAPAAPPSAAPTAPAASTAPAAQPRDVITALRESKLRPELVTALVNASVSADAIDARIEHARQVADLCASAKLDSCAASYVERNVSVETIRSELISAVADDPKTQVSTVIKNPIAAPSGPKAEAAGDIYNRRRAAAAGAGRQ